MKRILLYLLCCLTALSLLTGCSTSGPATTSDSAEAPLTAVVTIFPAYDWLRQLLGARADTWEITLLTDSGVDMHSYQPSTSDMAKVISCDLLIYVGGTSDAWLKDAIDRAEAPDCAAIDLMELLGDTAVTEELTDGMTAGDEEGEAPEYDEHVWLSPANARLFCAAIAEALTDLDPDGGETYAANLTAYDGELAALDAACRSVTENAELHTLLFGDRFPFRYFTDEYGLEYYAAFPGCSAETEASFETIAYLAGKLAELELPAVLVLEDSDSRIADTIIQSAGRDAAVLTLDAMQSTSADEIDGGVTYLSVMEQNLAVLETALNR